LDVRTTRRDEALVRAGPDHVGDGGGSLHDQLVAVVDAVVDPEVRSSGVAVVDQRSVARDEGRDAALVLQQEQPLLEPVQDVVGSQEITSPSARTCST
jgi:hypothetical protein